MKKIYCLAIVLCTLLVVNGASAKVYKQKADLKKSVVFEVCVPTYCFEQYFCNVKKYEHKTDAYGHKFVRVYKNDGTITDFTTENKTIKVKK